MNPREGLRKLLQPIQSLREKRDIRKEKKSLNESHPAVLERASSLLREINLNQTRIPQWLTAIEERIRIDRETDIADLSPIEFETPAGLYNIFENEKPDPNQFRLEHNIAFFPRGADGQIDKEDGRTLVVWYQSTKSSTFPDMSGNSLYINRTFATAHLELIKDVLTPEEDALLPNSSATAEAIRQNFPELFGLLNKDTDLKKEKLTAEERGAENFLLQQDIFAGLKRKEEFRNVAQNSTIDNTFLDGAENLGNRNHYKFDIDGQRFIITSEMVVTAGDETYAMVERKLTVHVHPSETPGADPDIKDGIDVVIIAKYNYALPPDSTDDLKNITHTDGTLIGFIGDSENIFDDSDLSAYDEARRRLMPLFEDKNKPMISHLDLPPVPTNEAYRQSDGSVSGR